MSGDHNAHQNDFHPDWDTVKAYEDKFAEMLDEIQRLRAELKITEQRLHDVATLCANAEAQLTTTQDVLKAVNTAAMKLTADLTFMEIDGDDRLDRDRVMERVVRWRGEWDKAMFEYRPKQHDPIVGTKTWFNEEGKIVQQELKRSEVYKDERQDIGGHRFNEARVAAQREWVGLTDEERNYIWDVIGNSDAHGDVDGWSGRYVIDAIEAKLKEKNQ